jgi:arylsulfatase A-like enzyme
VIALLPGLLACTVAPNGPPNILLISLDTVRADHTTPYGASNDTTPVLATLAEQGALFTHAFSNGNESAYSHASLFTGRYPSELAAPVYQTYGLPPLATTTAEALHAYGYATAAFSAGGHVTADFGFDQGWDHFSAEEGFGSLQLTAPRVSRWIRSADPERPWFAFLHAYDAHRPYVHGGVWDHLFAVGPGSRLAEALCSNSCLSEMVLGDALLPELVPEWFTHSGDQRIMDTAVYDRLAAAPADATRVAVTAADRAHIKAHYDGGLRYMDSLLGATLAELQGLGRLENTVVIVVSDHGEDLLDHGYMNHRTGLYDSCTRVPLVIWGPGFEGLGAIDGLVDARDVAATVLALAEARAPSGSGGRDLRAVAAGQGLVDVVFAEGVMDMVAARSATHRLVYLGDLADPDHASKLAGAALDGPGFRLYDLTTDPGEQVDVHIAQPEVTAELRDALVVWRQGLRTGEFEVPTRAVDPAVVRSLKQHGYWQDPAEENPAAPDAGTVGEESPPQGPGSRKDHLCRERFDFLPVEDGG